MSRLPPVAYGALVVATIGAFFVTQHLKVSNPLINGLPRPDPPAINPLDGRVCRDLQGRRVSFKRTRIGFYLQSRADTVIVSVLDGDGDIVATAGGSGRYVLPGPRRYVFFTWDGRESNGTFAPDGTYYFRVSLQQENRSFELSKPVQVLTTRPHPDVTSVVTGPGRAGTGPAIIDPPVGAVTIHFRRGAYHDAHIQIYRTDGSARPVLVKDFGVNGRRGRAVWDGLINGRPASAGTYLVGMRVTNAACNPGRFPVVMPPPAGSTPHAGVTVRYLAVQPPATPAPAGGRATVFVDSRRRPYTWALYRAGLPRILAHGGVSAGEAESGRGVDLSVPIPPRGAGLYDLAVTAGAHHTVVPLIASAAGRRAAARVLVVLPVLSWQGENPVDDDGSGLPETLAAGDRIDLDRPLVHGLPAAYPDQLALLRYLDAHHHAYQLTSDIALAEGVGPSLSGHAGVVLDGSLTWLPPSLALQLRTFAAAGGRVLSLGVHSLERSAAIGRTRGGTVAGPPLGPRAVDPFGAGHGALSRLAGQAVIVIRDQLGLFGTTSGIFSGFPSAQTITPPNGVPVSLAGAAGNTPAVTGFRVGRGTVVEIGLPGFAQRLSDDPDAAALLERGWRILSG